MTFFHTAPHFTGRQLIGRQRASLKTAPRRCGFECLETRQLLAADVVLGAVDLPLGQPGGLTGSISGSVFVGTADANCGSHDDAQSQSNVSVQLLDENGFVLEESVTDSQGSYRFDDLMPGDYAVRQLTPHGFEDGAAHVGEGGGVALNMDLVGEIIIHAGAVLEGYDFCDYETAPEPTGPIDRPITPHTPTETPSGLQFSVVALSLQQPASALPESSSSPNLPSVAKPKFVAQPPLNQPRPTTVFGGSSRVLKQPESIKAWDEYPRDGLFSTASFMDLASSQLPTIDDLVAADTPSSGDDAPFADGYTAKSIDWCEDGACFELDQIVGDALLSDAERRYQAPPEATRQATPEVARVEAADTVRK